MEGLDVLTSTQRDMVQAAIMPEPLPITEELTYESQELKMDLFMDEIPEDEFISGELLHHLYMGPLCYFILKSVSSCVSIHMQRINITSIFHS